MYIYICIYLPHILNTSIGNINSVRKYETCMFKTNIQKSLVAWMCRDGEMAFSLRSGIRSKSCVLFHALSNFIYHAQQHVHAYIKRIYNTRI